MGLTDWKFRVYDNEPPNRDTVATIEPAFGRRIACLWLSDDFLGESPESQRHTLCHELIHCHFQPAREIVRETLPDDAWPGFLRMFEYGIDAVAETWAVHLPLMLNVAPESDLPPEPESEPMPTPKTAPKSKAAAAKGAAPAKVAKGK
jgi:hypothetical protein